MTTTEQKSEVSYDRLQQEAEKLVGILKDRQTGLFTWHMFLNERLKSIHDLLCPHFGPK